MIDALVTLPEHFVGLRFYPGYFYNTEDQQLYSLKSGILKSLKIKNPYKNRTIDIGYHYTVSVCGWRKHISQDYLKNLKESQVTYKIKKDEQNIRNKRPAFTTQTNP